jgi:hypothetical protein
MVVTKEHIFPRLIPMQANFRQTWEKHGQRRLRQEEKLSDQNIE